MSDQRYINLTRRIAEEMKEPQKSAALYSCMKRGRDKRSEALAILEGGPAFRAEVKTTKRRCIADQDELLERFVANSRKRGAIVFLAKDGAEAIKYVLDLAKKRQAKIIAKSKSLTTEEIEINHPLENAGIRVVETDLGELIIQLVHEKPYHLVFPSVHKMAKDVAEIFSKETGQTVPNDIPEIMKVVRKYLRPIFLNAEIGMTGANIGIAENGAIVIETNEGNGRLVSSIGDCHVCVMGMEKIVDTLEDALLMVLAHPVSASGQLPTTYVTWMAGRAPLGEGDAPERGPRESHIIILDNGRSKMRNDPAMTEALHCIRCGACMNVCPTYGVVGGHTFGYIYPGPIGIPWTAEVHGLEKAGDFASLCVSCGLCKEICPADIDMPMMIAEVKHRDSKAHAQSVVNRSLMAAESFASFGSMTAPLSNWFLGNGLFRTALEKAIGIDRRRKLPRFSRSALYHRFSRTKSVEQSKAKRRVVFFPDIFANYNAPDLGLAAIRQLEAMGCYVELSGKTSSGYPYIGYGDLDKAREKAEKNVAMLAPYVRDGWDIVTTEPTAAYCLKLSYAKLLKGNPDATIVAQSSFEFFEYVLQYEDPDQLQSFRGKTFGFHIPCHQRPLSSGRGAIEWLKRRGANIAIIETGTCCGMAGTFGLKTGMLGYELANAVGAPLFKAFKESNVDAIVTESSVCSMQLGEGTDMTVMHPLELLGK
jgi:L-lactate dehydrogenase complex protein LldF